MEQAVEAIGEELAQNAVMHVGDRSAGRMFLGG